jgi:hypothetical protein
MDGWLLLVLRAVLQCIAWDVLLCSETNLYPERGD